MFGRIWRWYEKRMLESITFVFLIHIIQIPHMIWNCDQVYGMCGDIAGWHPVTDFLLLGVDFLEIPSIINVTFLWIVTLRKRYGE
jgi:hypothetical protein